MYEVSDKVWLEGKGLWTCQLFKKLCDRRYGPYKVTKIVGPNSYKLKLPQSMKFHPVFNMVKLGPYLKDPISERKQPFRLPPVIDGDNPEWEVEDIADIKLIQWKLHYLVKWKG